MSGYTTDGLPVANQFTGLEQAAFDTQMTQGQVPESVTINLSTLVLYLNYLAAKADLTTVAGSRYYAGVTVGTQSVLTGIQLLMGSVGGTDKLIVELHNSTGALVATSALAGVTAGTTALWQQIPFTAAYTAVPGQYYIVIQSNGTTAHPVVMTPLTSPIVTGSATGVFGTSASITPPTIYTTGLGPFATLY